MALTLLVAFGAGFYVATTRTYPSEKVHVLLNQYIHPKIAGGFYPYYKDRTSIFDMDSMTSCDVVMLGDSITDFAEWHEVLGRNVVNRGIAGDNTFGMLNRLEVSLKCNPKIVFLMLGVNDIKGGTRIGQTIATYKQIIDKIQAKGIDLVVQSTLYMAFDQEKTEATAANRQVAELNAAIRPYCEKRHLTWLDLNEFLSADGILRSDVTNDGLHLNGKGYQIWQNKVKEILALKMPAPPPINLDSLQQTLKIDSLNTR